MRKVNNNTSALMSSLQCALPSLRTEATRLILAALKSGEATQREAADELGTYDRSLRTMLDHIKTNRAKSRRKATKKRK